MAENDTKLIQLTHYFITIKNYTPMVVKGSSNEIWLENLKDEYKVIRINANHIHNKEQLRYDILKIKNVVKQIKRKTLSLNVPALSIYLDIYEDADKDYPDTKGITFLGIEEEQELEKVKKLEEMFPDFKTEVIKGDNSIDILCHASNEINIENTKKSIEAERIFKPKGMQVTYTLMGINIFIFLAGIFGEITGVFDLFTKLALHKYLIQSGEVYRLLTAAFTHANIFHLFMNMYSLYIIGGQVETYLGKRKYVAIYLLSAIMGSLLSCTMNTGWSLGASGAIFGLMGALLYFGLSYRLYLNSALRTQIAPLIAINLIIGFTFPNIDNAAHIGGLLGGIFISMIAGISEKKRDKTDMINGIICYTVLVGVLLYLLFIK